MADMAISESATAAADRSALIGLEEAGRLEAIQGYAFLGLPSQLIMVLLLFLADALATGGALYLGSEIHWISAGRGLSALALDPRLALAALALPVGYWVLDVYRVQAQGPIERFPLRIKVSCVLFALLMAWYFSAIGARWPLAAIGIAFLFALIVPLVGEGIVRTILIRQGLWGVPAVVIGAGPLGQQVARLLKQMPELGIRPVAFFDDSPVGQRSAMPVDHVPVLGSIADSAKYSRHIETAIVTTLAQSPDAVATQLGYRDIIFVPNLRELPSLWIRTRNLNGLLGLEIRRNLLLRRNRLIKRTIDLLIALPLLVLIVPIIAILAVWLRAVSEGSPFYAQLRTGKDGRPIKIWKLKTMYPDAEKRLEQHLRDNPQARREWERYFKLTDDPRVLPGVGHFLRRTSLDELPQIFNVIRGEMSLVGPRPFPNYHLDSFETSFRSLRSSVIPGITGLWQVLARSDGDLEVQQALDTYYIRNWSIWIDFYILSRTFGAVVRRRGAR